MSQSFKAQVDDIIKENVQLAELVVKDSVTELINEIQTPVAKGGKMRVDTGFLRASGRVSFNGMPAGPVRGRDRKPDEKGEIFNPEPVEASIGAVKIGDTIFFGWSANYAAAREARDGFLESGVQNWQSIVNRSIEKLKKAIGI